MFELIEQYEHAALYVHRGNGLKLMVWPYALAPVVGVQITYQVGSRHEVTGITGVAHLLEHLMFKGSKNFDQKHEMNIHVLEDRGALLNATTWYDRTNYYEVLLKKDVALALQIESDRMLDAQIREVDRLSEMPVVRNEYERGENNALAVLYKYVWALAYLAHPYHHNTIGWKADIENMSIVDIKAFYKKYYSPNNAFISLIGDIKVDEALSLVDKYFGSLPANKEVIPEIYTQEELQEGERHFVIRRADTSRWLVLAHKAPRGLDRDHLILQVLGKILSDGQLSYLHRILIDQGLASVVEIDIHPLYDPGLFSVYVNLSYDADPDHVLSLILNLYEEIKTGLLTEEDLLRAKTQLLAAKAFERDGIMGLLEVVNEGVACGDWKYGLELSNLVQDLSLADLQRVATIYLQNEKRISGFYLPKIDT